jgi:hypothetical protein
MEVRAMNLDISSLIPQLGVAAIFAGWAYKLYNDMREDGKRREEQMRNDSKEREEKLLLHLDKVADTLENINNRLCEVEKCVKKDGE